MRHRHQLGCAMRKAAFVLHTLPKQEKGAPLARISRVLQSACTVVSSAHEARSKVPTRLFSRCLGAGTSSLVALLRIITGFGGTVIVSHRPELQVSGPGAADTQGKALQAIFASPFLLSTADANLLQALRGHSHQHWITWVASYVRLKAARRLAPALPAASQLRRLWPSTEASTPGHSRSAR